MSSITKLDVAKDSVDHVYQGRFGTCLGGWKNDAPLMIKAMIVKADTEPVE